MADSAQKGTSHENVDNGCGAVDALFIVAHEAVPAYEPDEGSLDHPTPGQRLDAGLGVDAAHHFEDEIEERGLLPQLPAIVGAGDEKMLALCHPCRIASRINCTPALSEMSARLRLTISGRPLVSTAMWRLRLATYLAASWPRATSGAGALTVWLSIIPALGLASRSARSRSSIRATVDLAKQHQPYKAGTTNRPSALGSRRQPPPVRII